MTQFKKNKTKKMIMLANLTAIAIVLSLVESQLNIIPVPGARLGLANLITVIVIYMFSFKEAFVTLILRILIVSILSGKLLSPTFYMGLSGAILSLLVMGILKQLRFGTTIVSLFSSIAHQIGQIIAGMFVIGTQDIIYYLPIMLPIGVVSGIIIGIIAEKFVLNFKDKYNQEDNT